MPSRYESLASATRPNDAHGIALQLVGTGKRVLELGAANGHVTKELAARGNSVVAVEIDDALRDELARFADKVIIANLDDLELPSLVDFEQFDVVLAGDVLEHTVNTRLVLEQMRLLIKPDGHLVVSVPNIAHGDVRLALLDGEFRYRDVGILDRTHRTFFTRETLVEFLEVNGFGNLEIFASTTPVGSTEIRPDMSNLPQGAIDHVVRDPLSIVYQYVVKATPHHTTTSHSKLDVSRGGNFQSDPRLFTFESALTRLTTELSEARDMSNRVDEQLAALSQQIAQLNLGEGLALRDYSLGLLAELGEARAQLLAKENDLHKVREELAETIDRLAAEMTRAHEAEKQLVRLQLVAPELAAIKASFTWKIGRFFMLPARIVRRLFR